MAVWFSPNHGIEFSDIGTVFQTVQDRVLMVGIRVVFCSRKVGKCMLDFVVNYFGIVFGPSLRTTSWLNL